MDSEYISKGDLISQLSKTNTALDKRIANTRAVLKAINSYVANTTLKGNAYNSSRAHMQKVQVTLFTAMITADTDLKSANNKMKSNAAAIKADPVNTGLLSSLLASRKADLAKNRAKISTQRATPPASYDVHGAIKAQSIALTQAHINAAQSDIKFYQQILDSVNNFENNSAGLYASVEAQYAKIAQTAAKVKALAFDSSSGYVPLPGDLAALLGELDAIALDRAMAQLMGEDGKTPNWAKIKDWLQTDPSDLTSAQIDALAQAALDMPTDQDFEKFIGCGYMMDYLEPYGRSDFMMRQTDTFKVVTTLIEQSVTAAAIATVWADPPYVLNAQTAAMMKRYIERMQVLQIAAAVGDIVYDGNCTTLDGNITTDPSHVSDFGPIRLSRAQGGDLQIEIAFGFDAGPENPSRPTHFYFDNKPLVVGGDAGITVEGADRLQNIQSKNLLNLYIGNGADLESIVGDTVAGKVRDQLIGSIIKNVLVGASEATIGAATLGATTIAAIAVNAARSSADYQDRLKTGAAMLDQINEANGIAQLGGKVSFTNVNGTIVIHYIQNDTIDSVLNTNGFLNTIKDSDFNGGKGYSLTPAQLQQILGTGDPKDVSWKPLTNIGLKPEQQKEIANAFSSYDNNLGNMADKSRAYNNALDVYLQLPSTQAALQKEFGAKYPDLSLLSIGNPNHPVPAEVIKAVIELRGY